ncbi:MAG: hybrid sensor histidine kinase/response regulator [Planctomycetes bacterium]|nr:hybrid sensor histidine kinase/response regulator [Planctomycetota bacterium]
MSKRSILAVDDNEVNLEILREILDDDFELRTANCGEEALALMAERSPELVLLDIMMPGIDGYEVCERIRSDPRQRYVKVILVSARGMTSERLRGYKAGANDYVVKPFDKEELLAKIHVFLQLKAVEELDRMKSDLLMVLAHEIRTPLTGIIPAGEMLSAPGEMDVEQRQMWGEMVATAGRDLLALAERGLLLCQMREQTVQLELESVDLCAELQRVNRRLSRSGRHADQPLHIEAPPELVVQGDHRLLLTALECAIEGALRIDPSGGEVHVELSTFEGRAQLAIRVPGAHPDQENFNRLFEPLRHREVGGETVGTDLSLALARLAVEAHGGRVEAVRGDPRGFELTVEVPCSARHPTPQRVGTEVIRSVL